MPRKKQYKTRDQLIQENKKLLEELSHLKTEIERLQEKKVQLKKELIVNRRLHFKLGTQSRSS